MPDYPDAQGGRHRRRGRRLERPDSAGEDAGADHREDPERGGRARSATPAIREKLATQIMEPIPTTPAQFRAKIDADLARWAPVIKALDLKIN